MVDFHDYDRYPLPFFCRFYYNGGELEIIDANLRFFKGLFTYLEIELQFRRLKCHLSFIYSFSFS